jgi:hypothetical protein
MSFINDISWGRYAVPAMIAEMALGTTNPGYFGGPVLVALGYVQSYWDAYYIPNSFSTMRLPIVRNCTLGPWKAGVGCARVPGSMDTTEVLKILHMQAIAALLIMGFLWRVFAFLALLLVDREKQNKPTIGAKCRVFCHGCCGESSFARTRSTANAAAAGSTASSEGTSERLTESMWSGSSGRETVDNPAFNNMVNESNEGKGSGGRGAGEIRQADSGGGGEEVKVRKQVSL